jgi:ankyrin repeat protein
MNPSDINPNLPCLRHLAYARRQNRHMSCITSIPILIQLCIYPDEKYAYRTMRILFSSCSRYSPNVCDEFGCNVLMYSLRYQRYKLFEFLLKETTLDLNLCAKDQQGNTILHYAILYGDKDTQIIDRLIEKYHKYAIEIDQRNSLGFTPLLLGEIVKRILMKYQQIIYIYSCFLWTI